MWRQGFGSNQVDFGGRNWSWSAISNIELIDGDFTKKTGWVWVSRLLKSNIIEGINLIGWWVLF